MIEAIISGDETFILRYREGCTILCQDSHFIEVLSFEYCISLINFEPRIEIFQDPKPGANISTYHRVKNTITVSACYKRGLIQCLYSKVVGQVLPCQTSDYF